MTDVVVVTVPASPAVIEVEVAPAPAVVTVEVPGIAGPQGDPGIIVSDTAPGSPSLNQLWLEI